MPTDHVQTKTEIAGLLDAYGARPRKRLGQHFLIDGNLMRRLVESAELDTTDLVLEVGGGTGGLTDLLAARAGRVLCVEIDRDLGHILEDRFREAAHVTVIQGDILEGKHRIMPGIADAIGGHLVHDGRRVVLVSNLPYQVATPLVMNLLVDFPQVRRLCFTVQAEVGERIMAAANTKAYGPLSILSQTMCSIRPVARIPPQAFWPRPAVDSLMIRMDPIEPPPLAREAFREFAALVHGAFDHRRKTLRSALAYVLGKDACERVNRAFDTSRRPESFTVAEWRAVYRTIKADAA